ncbi:class II aldolase/adducin family protein [Paenibacillus marinisediminis]
MLEKTSAYLSDFEAKKMICEIGRRMYNKNFVAANDGNITIKTGPNTIWATPTGVSKGFMTPDMLVKLDLSGKVLAGKRKPSSEIKMHLRVYKENPNVTAVVHAHPPVATSFAIAGIDLDKAVSPEAVVILGTVPVAPYATPGTEEVPNSIAPYCKDYNAVLLANHGALTWGTDIIEAYYRMESLEHYALMLMYSGRIINQANELNCNQVSDLITIRAKMGITSGGTPACKYPSDETGSGQAAAASEPSVGLSELSAKDKQDMIEAIVAKVTEQVLKKLSR